MEGFSIPDDIEPGDHDEVVAIPGDMPAMDESGRNAGRAEKIGLTLRKGHCTASFINQTNEQSNQVKDAYVVA